MEANKIYEVGKELTYAVFPSKFVWKSESKTWEERKRGFAIGRIYYAHTASGDRYYMRMLLNTKKGCTSFRILEPLMELFTQHTNKHAKRLDFLMTTVSGLNVSMKHQARDQAHNYDSYSPQLYAIVR